MCVAAIRSSWREVWGIGNYFSLKGILHGDLWSEAGLTGLSEYIYRGLRLNLTSAGE